MNEKDDDGKTLTGGVFADAPPPAGTAPDRPTLTHLDPPVVNDRATLTHHDAPGAFEHATLTHNDAPVRSEGATLTHLGQAASRVPAPAEPQRAEHTLPEGSIAYTGTVTPPEELGDWKIGDVIDGKYEVREKLGHGGMGVVYRVHHRHWRIDLAVKIPTRRLVDHPTARQRFLREAETWVGLGVHPNIVQCWYVRELGGVPRLFLDYVAGGNLKQALRAGKVGPGQWDRVIDLMVQACDGLSHAHQQGMVHRDVKPANMLLTSDDQLKVTDFGLVRQMGTGDEPEPEAASAEPVKTLRGATQVGAGLGTAEYGAPEQWLDARRADHRADIYALGMTLFELCTGRRAFDDGRHDEPASAIIARHLAEPVPDPRRFRADVPEALALLIVRCLAKEPAARPQSARDLRVELGAVHAAVVGKPLDRKEPRAVDLRAEALNNRAVSLWDLGRQDQAQAAWTEALNLDPAQLEAFFNRSLLDWRQGRINAEFLLARLEEAKQQHRWAGIYAGYFQLERLALEEATRELAEALGDGDIAADAAAWRALGHALLARESPQDAAEAYAEALTRAPFDEQATVGKAIAEKDSRANNEDWALPSGRRFPHPRVLWTGHEAGAVRRLALAGQGNVLLAATRERTGASRVLVWAGKFESPVAALDVHAGVEAVAVVPDGRRVVSAGADGSVQLWNLDWGNCRRAFRDPGRGMTQAALTGDGMFAVTAGNDARARLWDMRVMDLPGARHAAVLEGHREAPRCLVALPVAPVVATGGQDGAIALWDVRPGWWQGSALEPVRWLKGHEGAVLALAPAPDGRALASAGADGTVRVWDVESGKTTAVYRELAAPVVSVAWTPDATRLVAGATDRSRGVWTLSTGKCERVFGLEHLRDLVVLPGDTLVGHDGRQIVAIDLTADLELMRAPLMCSRARGHSEEAGHHHRFAELLEQARTAEKAGNRRLALAFLGAARSVPGFERDPVLMELSNRLSRTVPRRSLIGCWMRRTVGWHPRPVSALAVAADGLGVLTASEDDVLRWWRPDGDTCLSTTPVTGGRSVAVALLPDGKTAACAAADGSVRLVELETGRARKGVTGLGKELTAAAFAPDGTAVVAAIAAGQVLRASLSGGERVSVFGGAVRTIAVGPDGWTVIAGSGPQLLVWRRGDQVPRLVAGHIGDILAVAITPDGQTGLTASADHTVRSWDLTTGALRQIYLGHDGPVTSLTITPDGRFAFSGGHDGIIHLWDLAQPISQRQFPEGSPHVHALAVTADGRFLFSAAQQLKVWELDWEFQSQA